MKKEVFILALLAMMLVAAAGCAPGTIAQINTPVPSSPGTPAPSGQINVPGVTIQVRAPGPNPLLNTADEHGRVAGIALGLWHGIISPVPPPPSGGGRPSPADGCGRGALVVR